MKTVLELDYEGLSEVDLTKFGLDRYTSHPSTKGTLCSYAFNGATPKLWDHNEGPFPRELKEALEDPHVEKWAFNAQFERVFTQRVMKINTPYEGWRCAMVLGHMHAFTGTLDMMVRQCGLPDDKNKLADGKRLIRKFCMPQKVTKNQPYVWRDCWTDPEDWEIFRQYCVQDLIAERAFKNRLMPYPVPPEEWKIYEYDQMINDRGLPIDLDFVENAIVMSDRRKAELTDILEQITGLSNPNSPKQLTGWLVDRGYPFEDINKDTVKKVLAENGGADFDTTGRLKEVTSWVVDQGRPYSLLDAPGEGSLSQDVIDTLLIRQQAARTSVTKFKKLRDTHVDGYFRFGFQYGGAARTLRWAGRGFQPHNLMRTPKFMEPDKDMLNSGVPADYVLDTITNMIREGDYEALALMVNEPMEAIAGAGRSAIRAPDGYEIVAVDLSSIESRVLAWLAGCERLLNVFRTGKDPYIDFATDFYEKAYELVTKRERQDSKPAVLGAGYRLGGGDLKNGKRTGLWGYAENMGIQLTREQSHKAVRKFRNAYPEIPKLWYALEDAAMRAIRNPSRPAVPIIKLDGGKSFRVPVQFEMRKPYLEVILPMRWPSGEQRRLRYKAPRIQQVTHIGRDGEEFTKPSVTYMGMIQGTRKWARMETHGGKFVENIVQAIARDVLAMGLMRAMNEDWPLFGHVHDELMALVRKGSNQFSVEALREIMIAAMEGLEGLLLDAAGSAVQFYRKD